MKDRRSKKREPAKNLIEGLGKSTMALQAIEHLRAQLHQHHVAREERLLECLHCKAIWEKIAAIQKAMENTRRP